MRRALLAVAALGACAWELPRPAHPADAGDAGADARADRPSPTDLPRVDAPAPDVPADRPDVTAPRDVVAAADVVDVSPALDAPSDRGPAPDLVDVPIADRVEAIDVVAPQDVVIARDAVDVGVAECVVGARRSCFTGPAVSRGAGVCRDGVQTCLATGRWGATCDGQILPSCAGRACGPDGCAGSCGACATGLRCDDLGQCVAPVCGAANFTLTCPDTARCPRDSHCLGGGRCECDEGFTAVSCGGVACGACAFPDWWCQRTYFCGAGSISCAGGYLCPTRSRCEEATRSCACEAGFVAVDCAGARCTACAGVAYRCVPP